MAAKPGALFVVDVITAVNAVKEAQKLNIPIIAMVDTNADPSDITYPIPANDDAIKTIQLITDHIKQAVMTGKAKTEKSTKTEEKEGDK